MTTNLNHRDPFKDFLRIMAVLLLLLSLGVFYCCASKPQQTAHTIEHIIESKTDSVKVTQINKAILDSLIIKLAKVKTAKPECDSITQVALDQALRQLNTYKKSGSNEASVHYDETLKQIVVLLKQGETQTENASINKIQNEKQTESKTIVIREKYIPVWVKILASIGGLTSLFLAWRFGRIFI